MEVKPTVKPGGAVKIYFHRYWPGHYGVLFVCKSWWRWMKYFNLVFARCSLPVELVILDAETANPGIDAGDYGEILKVIP